MGSGRGEGDGYKALRGSALAAGDGEAEAEQAGQGGVGGGLGDGGDGGALAGDGERGVFHEIAVEVIGHVDHVGGVAVEVVGGAAGGSELDLVKVVIEVGDADSAHGVEGEIGQGAGNSSDGLHGPAGDGDIGVNQRVAVVVERETEVAKIGHADGSAFGDRGGPDDLDVIDVKEGRIIDSGDLGGVGGGLGRADNEQGSRERDEEQGG